MSERAEKYGFVYVMCNDAMPGYYKIGATCRPPSIRAAELSASTSIPCIFEIVMYAEVEDPFLIEAEIHEIHSESRVTPNREFFRFDLDGIVEACNSITEQSSLVCYAENYDMIMYAFRNKQQKSLEVIK